jgi:hypothetical protein
LKSIYDDVFLSRNGAVISKNIYKKEVDNEVLEIYLLDASGDIVINITKELERQNGDIRCIIEFEQLNDYLFEFQYPNWDSLELRGVFNEKGGIIIKPEYDEIELISETLLLCYHGAHYKACDSLGNENYGHKPYNVFGEKLEYESINYFEELEDGRFLFETTSKNEFIVSEFGKREAQ